MATSKSGRRATIAGVGSVEQLAFVPEDFDAAIAFWTQTMGVGPFYLLRHIPLVNAKYYGQPTEIDSTVALSYWGDLQIEIIKQHNDDPSSYKEWVDKKRDGVHHIRVDVEDIEKARKLCEDAGGVAACEGEVMGQGHFIYFDMGDNGPMVEVVWLDKSFNSLFDFIKQAARNWDGTDPVRDLPSDSPWE